MKKTFLYFTLLLTSQLAFGQLVNSYNSADILVDLNKLNTLSTSDLIVEVKKLASDFENGTELLFDVAMDILMGRLPEKEFVEFCNSL